MDQKQKAGLLAEYGKLVAEYVQNQKSETQQRLKEIETTLGMTEREILQALLENRTAPTH